jgi:hypothetical protein
MLGNVIIFNNMVAAIVLSPLILVAVYPRVQAGRLLYGDVMPGFRQRALPIRVAGLVMLLLGEVGAWITGNLISSGYWAPGFIPLSFAHAPYDKAIAIVVSPLITLAVAGMMLL